MLAAEPCPFTSSDAHSRLFRVRWSANVVSITVKGYAGPLECGVPNESRETDRWRVISRPSFGLATLISDAISGSPTVFGNRIRWLRSSSTLLMFSDYGGAHKGARYEVFSYLVTTPLGFSGFNAERGQLREAGLGSRRISFKALNDNVRLRSLPGFLKAADNLAGLISFALDKHAAHRFNETYQADTAFGALGRGRRRRSASCQESAILRQL